MSRLSLHQYSSTSLPRLHHHDKPVETAAETCEPWLVQAGPPFSSIGHISILNLWHANVHVPLSQDVALHARHRFLSNRRESLKQQRFLSSQLLRHRSRWDLPVYTTLQYSTFLQTQLPRPQKSKRGNLVHMQHLHSLWHFSNILALHYVWVLMLNYM